MSRASKEERERRYDEYFEKIGREYMHLEGYDESTIDQMTGKPIDSKGYADIGRRKSQSDRLGDDSDYTIGR